MARTRLPDDPPGSLSTRDGSSPDLSPVRGADLQRGSEEDRFSPPCTAAPIPQAVGAAASPISLPSPRVADACATHRGNGEETDDGPLLGGRPEDAARDRARSPGPRAGAGL